MDIFKENRLYPQDSDPVLEYYTSCFDKVYIALSPFSRLNEVKVEAYLRGNNLDEKIERIRKNIPQKERADNYPYQEEFLSLDEVYLFAEEISWDEILVKTGISDIKLLNKVLLTSIGALRKELREQEKSDFLVHFSETQNIWLPIEGAYDELSKIGIYNLFNKYNLNELVVIDEFYQTTKEINISGISEREFLSIIGNNDYYIYSKDKEVLFSIHWDSFFFFIAIDSAKINIRDVESLFHGFWANEEDSHLWCYEKGEIDYKLSENNNI